MKLKKLTALLLAGAMTMGLVACGGEEATTGNADAGSNTETKTEAKADDTAAGLEGKLVIWTLAADLEQFATKFTEENPGVETEVVVIAPADYPTKVEAALLANSEEPDIIVGEPQMLESM